MTDLDEQGLIETWHERFRRLVLAKDYAGALALLRSSAPDYAKQVARAETAEARLQSLEKERDRARKSLRTIQEAAGAALMKLGVDGDGLVADFLCALHREAVCGLLADDSVTNEASPP